MRRARALNRLFVATSKEKVCAAWSGIGRKRKGADLARGEVLISRVDVPARGVDVGGKALDNLRLLPARIAGYISACRHPRQLTDYAVMDNARGQ